MLDRLPQALVKLPQLLLTEHVRQAPHLHLMDHRGKLGCGGFSHPAGGRIGSFELGILFFQFLQLPEHLVKFKILYLWVVENVIAVVVVVELFPQVLHAGTDFLLLVKTRFHGKFLLFSTRFIGKWMTFHNTFIVAYPPVDYQY